MDAMEMLLTRTSAVRLASPGPAPDELDAIFRAALRAPDHGRLRPWRFVIVPEDKRERLGHVLADSLRRRELGASTDALQREREKALRAPVIVIAAAHVEREHKIPAIEQLSSTAAAAQTIMLAAHALGFGAMWKTGAPAYDNEVKRALGLEPTDEIVGFLYLGTRVGAGSLAPRPAPQDLVSVWPG